MSNKPLRNYLRAFRRQCEFSQSDIAFITGWRDGRTVSNYERFKTVPSLETALMCERIFNAPVRELFAGMYSKVDHIVSKRVRVLLEESETAPDRGEKAKIRSLPSLLQEEPSVHNHWNLESQVNSLRSWRRNTEHRILSKRYGSCKKTATMLRRNSAVKDFLATATISLFTTMRRSKFAKFWILPLTRLNGKGKPNSSGTTSQFSPFQQLKLLLRLRRL